MASWAPERLNSAQKRPREQEEACGQSFTGEKGEGNDFRLPITHRPTENLDTENLEQASVDTQLTSANIGFRLLQKMGWKGKGLGREEQGIVEPIKTGARDAKLGLGKQEQDDFYTSEENIQRRKLEVELEETEELAKKREVVAEREQKIQSEVKEIRKVFFCELCNKQYKLAMEFESHLSSYDHNHRKRFKQMKVMHTGGNRDDRQKRELLRQEKEMAKFLQQEDSGSGLANATVKTATSLSNQEQRKALKFGFGKTVSKTSSGPIKKDQISSKVSSVFGEDSGDESS
eukprot:TRINITY_DN2633_c0_g1_i4.p1 TRINITY_DN2633_c0_g1~~TRINITY_DN2633_c0_g1_i4.p1  ORF type:complete len:289 (-),score=87.72 TRINITY_DN2633_c0_g1_i4:176-1042(-)